MELIEALEQLSLHVRSNRNKLLVGDYSELSSSRSSANFNTDGSSEDVHFDTLDQQAKITTEHHFQEFNSSIDTLYAQLNDLDDNIALRHGRSDTNLDAGSNSFSHNNKKRFFTASLETSQEDDSDNSSSTHQSSSCATSSSTTSTSGACNRANPLTYHHHHHHHIPHINSLVVSLLKRDLGAITETVRKISKILALGKEIESIYKEYFYNSNQIPQHLSSHGFIIQPATSIDLNRCRSLCDTFISLCSSEPCICDLPTILHYQEYCHLLMTQLDKFTQQVPPPSQTAAITGQYNNFTLDNLNSATSTSDLGCNLIETKNMILSSACQELAASSNDHEVTVMQLDDAREALDCALLECDQEQLNNDCWTNNKLYVVNQAEP